MAYWNSAASEADLLELQLPRGSTKTQLRTQYRKLSLKWHEVTLLFVLTFLSRRAPSVPHPARRV